MSDSFKAFQAFRITGTAHRTCRAQTKKGHLTTPSIFKLSNWKFTFIFQILASPHKSCFSKCSTFHLNFTPGCLSFFGYLGWQVHCVEFHICHGHRFHPSGRCGTTRWDGGDLSHLQGQGWWWVSPFRLVWLRHFLISTGQQLNCPHSTDFDKKKNCLQSLTVAWERNFCSNSPVFRDSFTRDKLSSFVRVLWKWTVRSYPTIPTIPVRKDRCTTPRPRQGRFLEDKLAACSPKSLKIKTWTVLIYAQSRGRQL